MDRRYSIRHLYSVHSFTICTSYRRDLQVFQLRRSVNSRPLLTRAVALYPVQQHEEGSTCCINRCSVEACSPLSSALACSSRTCVVASSSSLHFSTRALTSSTYRNASLLTWLHLTFHPTAIKTLAACHYSGRAHTVIQPGMRQVQSKDIPLECRRMFNG